jgi:hypothetical protein
LVNLIYFLLIVYFGSPGRIVILLAAKEILYTTESYITLAGILELIRSGGNTEVIGNIFP